MAKPSYHILITAIEAFGHINAVCGFGEVLTRHGHRVTFAQRSKYKKFADQHGFGFIPFDEDLIGSYGEEAFLSWLDANADKYRQDPMKRFKNYTEEEKLRSFDIEQFRKLNSCLVKLLSENTFDAIVQDAMDVLDCLYKTEIPVISSCSCVPLCLYEAGPPGFSGLSTNDDPSLWEEFRNDYKDAYSKFIEAFNSLLRESGRAELFDPLRWNIPPKTIGFYHYPADLDYVECGSPDPGWHRIESYVRSPDEDTFEIPEKLVDKPGKLIYFSLGSTASVDLKLMRQALSALARSPHRFIISLGRRGDQLSLADNMWGQEYVNQVKIISMVDLVITHGGNNTFMETLYYGKPMIVIPYFFDQLDNAQRVVDKNIGHRVNPWDFNEDYLLECIENLLEDTDVQERVKSISQNMRNSESSSKAVQMIEEVIEKSKQ